MSHLITGVTAKFPESQILDTAQKRRHKYGAKPLVADGHRFASKAEAKRYQQLKLLQDAGTISALRLQPRYELAPKAQVGSEKLRAITYVADFEYVEDGQTVVEDVKGVETPIFRLKANLFRRRYPDVDFRIVRK